MRGLKLSRGQITFSKVLQWSPRAALAYAAALIAIISVTDSQVEINATLGFLYMFPMVLLGMVFNWWQLIASALFCVLLSDRLDPFPMMDMNLARDVLVFLTLSTTGLLSLTVTKSYRRERESFAARQAAEEQMAFLIESSPAAILMMAATGEIVLANPSAHRLLDVADRSLKGKHISRYVPALGSIPLGDDPKKVFRTEMQTRGHRGNGELFLASVFFSTYSTPQGHALQLYW